MFHRVFSILLIASTLLAPSVCCCTLAFGESALAQTPACCCQLANPGSHCPATPYGEPEHEGGHKCPCQQYRSLAARLDECPALPSPASTAWLVNGPELWPSLFCMAATDQCFALEIILANSQLALVATGSGQLIALCVCRC